MAVFRHWRDGFQALRLVGLVPLAGLLLLLLVIETRGRGRWWIEGCSGSAKSSVPNLNRCESL